MRQPIGPCGGGILSNPEEGDERREIVWTCLPARDRPVAAVLVGLFLLGIWTAIQLSWGEWFLTAIAVLVLWGSLASFYIPTRFRMDDETISVGRLTGKREKPWSRYRRAAADRYGVHLSPFERRSRLDRFHGLNLRFDRKDRERVLAFVAEKVPLDVQDGK